VPYHVTSFFAILLTVTPTGTVQFSHQLAATILYLANQDLHELSEAARDEKEISYHSRRSEKRKGRERKRGQAV